MDIFLLYNRILVLIKPLMLMVSGHSFFDLYDRNRREWAIFANFLIKQNSCQSHE